MKVLTKELEFKTKGNNDIINITDSVLSLVEKSGVSEGTATLFVVGSTAGLSTCEYEPALVSDIKKIFEKLVPRDVSYAHDDTWGDANGYAHLRATLFKAVSCCSYYEGAFNFRDMAADHFNRSAKFLGF
jgi:secondary thiamine-phosphate synthase enzyme